MQKQAHIQLDESINCSKAIIVGDPARVSKVEPYLEEVTVLANNREFYSIKGIYQGESILVLSTGIGAPSTAIAIEEMYQIGVREVIRVGSCGAMQKDIALGELIIASGAVRDEGLTSKYVPLAFPAVPDSHLLQRAQVLYPKAHVGVIRSHDGFYMDNNDEIETFWSQQGVLGADMETSCLFIVGGLRGMKTASILNNVVLFQADLTEGINDLVEGDEQVVQGERASIELALAVLTKGAE